VFLFNENHEKEYLLGAKIYMSILIILALPLYALIGYLWNADPLFQNYWGAMGVAAGVMYYATSCLFTTVFGIMYQHEDIENASNILGLVSAIMIIPACILVFGCVRVG